MANKLSWSDKRICTGTSPIAENFADAPTWVCKGVGGSTLHWTGTCERFKDFELSARTIYGEISGTSLADWPIGLADLAPYYDRAEDKMGVTGTNGIPFHSPGNNYKVLAAGARRIGYTQVDTNRVAINSEPRDGRNACDQIGFCMQGCRSGAKWSTFNAELPKAEATGRCEVRPECMALRIEHDSQGRASGVLYADKTGAPHNQKARAVCVAGNAIETPRLLLNSESSAFPDGLANGSGMVGKNYMRHVFAYAYAQFERPVNMHPRHAGRGRDPRRAAVRPRARLRRRFPRHHRGVRPSLLRRLPRSVALGPRAYELDRGVRPHRLLGGRRRGHGDRDQPRAAARNGEGPVRPADPPSSPRRSPQRLPR